MNQSKLTPVEMQAYLQLTGGEVLPNDNITMQTVKRLRGKLGKSFVENRRGEGYIIGRDTSSIQVDSEAWTFSRSKET